MYAPLWVKTNFSFLEGASHPAELVERAHALGLPALAVTDRDGVYGIVRAHVRAKALGLRVIIGAQVTVQDTEAAPARPVILLAIDRAGYGHLCQLLSAGRARCPKGQSRTLTAELRAAGPGLLALCPDPALLPALREPFADRLYALVTRHHHDDDHLHEQALRTAAAALDVPVVAGTEVLYHDRSRRPLQDIVTCIRHGCTLATAGTRIRGNAEHELLPPAAMQALFADDPAALHRTLEIADRCTFSLADIRYRYPAERIPAGHSERDWLRHLTYEGAARRFPAGLPAPMREQLDRELALIAELDYGGYFLTMYEIVERCREQGILCQGRGSAANSAVCYCLGITAIDPVKMDLLFERFLSRERAEPPDIDLDIEHQRREEVIQWVYARYGRRHAAMVANVIRYRARSAVREVGKALGLPVTALDRLAKLLSHYGGEGGEGSGEGGWHGERIGPELLVHAGLDPKAPVHQHLLRLTGQLIDAPRHLSIHPGGFLLGHAPVDTLVPIEPATMEGRTVVQWDKYDVEDLGLFKVDLLGLGALSMVQRALAMLERHEGQRIALHEVPTEDPATYDMISRGDTLGVFQIESRAQMAMLPRLRPRTFYDLVIEVAIVRPGPIQGDMVHPYLRRRQGLEPVEYPHPALRRVLEKTNGVPIFQEQVMKLAVAVADYTGGEADELRRDMAAWRSAGRIEKHRERLLGAMAKNGIAPAFAERVYSQIQGFGEYGFPESHAASFALIAYVTAWLRCHHPAVFAAALLNAQPMGFYSPASIVEDAKRRGVPVRPVCVMESDWDCTLEPAGDEAAERSRWALRMGLRLCKGLGEHERQRLAAAPPPYADLGDLARRTRLPLRSLQALAEAGALSCFGLSRRDALWAVRGLWAQKADDLPLPADQAPAAERPRFGEVHPTEAILWDYRASRHSTRGHPMETIRPSLPTTLPCAQDVALMRDRQRTDFVGLVICRQRPGTASGVTFLTLEDETGFVNVVVWKRVFDEHAILIKSAAVLGVSGRVQREDGVVHLVAERLWEPVVRAAAPPTQIRSFH
jgi:error-prone DNA polymerase